jgi:hypothetical protein
MLSVLNRLGLAAILEVTIGSRRQACRLPPWRVLTRQGRFARH